MGSNRGGRGLFFSTCLNLKAHIRTVCRLIIYRLKGFWLLKFFLSILFRRIIDITIIYNFSLISFKVKIHCL